MNKKYKEYTPEELDKLVLDAFQYYGNKDELEEEELVAYFMKFVGVSELEAEYIVCSAEDKCIIEGFGQKTSGGRNVVYWHVHPKVREERKKAREYMIEKEVKKIEREDEFYSE